MPIISRLRLATLVTIAALSPIAVAVGGGIARADAPAPGDACTVLHATTHDVNGRMMWCNPTMTGAHNLVWQYGGPS
jgi:hypothetical protein